MKRIVRDLTSQSKPVRVHGISTGLVAVKRQFRESRLKGIPAMIASFLDRKFTEWMPIWTWVIEHPEGVFLIDTGENCRVNESGYFRSSGRFEQWLNTSQFRFQVRREDEIDAQLTAIGLPPQAITRVILTHLHLDHIDGLHHFPETPVLVNRLEWEKPYGDLPKLYPPNFLPELVELNESYGPFNRVHFLTNNRDLLMIETPGHTHGHTAVLLKTDQGAILFAGDVAYHQEQLARNRFAAANVDPQKARQTYARIHEFARKQKLVVLPSHDAGCAERLVNMEPFQIR